MTILGMVATPYIVLGIFNFVASIVALWFLDKHDEIRVWHVVVLPLFIFLPFLNVMFAIITCVVAIIALIVHFVDIVEYPVKDIPKLWRKRKDNNE